MKILMFLTKLFKNDSRVYQEAMALREVGGEIHIIDWARHDFKKTLSHTEKIDGINIHYIHDNKLMKKLRSATLKNPLWWLKGYKKSLKIYKKGFSFNVVHCHDLDTLMIGVMLKKNLGVKLIYDAHEVFGYMIERETYKIIAKAAFLFEKILIRYVDIIITVNEPLKKYFTSISNKALTIVMNCKELVKDTYSPTKNNIFTASYIGILHKNRMFPQIIDIIGNIKSIKFIIAGKKENLYKESKLAAKKYNNIEFLGSIPFKEVIPTTFRSDTVICMINPDDLNDSIGLANKQFEAMVCGRPIITTKNTYVGELTEKLHCGLVIDYNKESLKKALLELKNNPKLCEELGKNALKAAKEKYNWQNEKKKLLQVYKMLS